MKFEHWLKAVSLSSLGLCVINVNKVPYFLPSFAILSKILYPNNLREAHDELYNQIEVINDPVIDEKIKKLQASLYEPNIYNDYNKVNEINDNINKLEEELLELMTKLEELNS